MTTPLQKAAQALIERWDSPSWKDQPHTAEYIAELRKALEAEIAQTEAVDRNLRVTEQAVEPYVACLSNCETCEYSAINPVTDGSVHCYMFRSEPIGVCASWTPIEVAPPQPQATTAVPEGYVLVPKETLMDMKNRVNTLATLSLKAERYSVGISIKQTIADILAAAQGEKP